MNIDNFCNLGAALQNRQIEVGKQPQIYFYRSNEDSIYEMLSEGYFNALNLRVAKDDLILLYSPKDERKVFAKVVSNSGGIVQIIEMSEDVFQYDEMPIPSIEYLNKIGQYTGETTTEAPIYTNGFFYKCVENSGVYSWENIITQDSYLKSETYSKTESDDRFVHKTGDETISDIKTFTGISSQDPLENHIIIQNLKDDFRYSDGTKNYHISFRDKNNKECGYMGYNHTDKSSFIELGARKTPLGNLVSVLEVGFDDDGNKYTYAPEPTEDTVDSHQLDTVGARNKKLESYQEKETALNYNNISNCITYIPQDITIELSSGIFTAKSGSKSYIPNGSSYTPITINEDKTISTGLGDGLNFIAFDETDGNLFGRLISNSVSGSGATTNNGYAYDTTANRIAFHNANGSVARYTSFPIAVVNVENSVITEVVQVFNGFGYIGHHTYKLPNVKGLVAYGRNTDETLKSFTVGSSDIQLYELPNNQADTYMYISRANAYIMGSKVSDGYPKYDANKNWCYCNSTSVDSFLPVVKFATNSSNQVTLFEIKAPFHAVDYSDTEFIGHQAMPSDRYIDLTLGASGTEYTAPADGWVIFRRTSTASGQYLQLANNTSTRLQYFVQSGANNGVIGVSLPVKKGDVFVIGYTLNSNVNQIFRFIYAEGSK